MRTLKRIALLFAMLAACAGAFADADIDLYNAVKLNRLGDVQTALRMGANPNQKIAAGGGKSSFALAIENQNMEIIETMLKDSHEMVAINGEKDSEPPLFAAIRTKNDKLMTMFIKYGANPNVKYRNSSPLFYLLSLTDNSGLLESFFGG